MHRALRIASAAFLITCCIAATPAADDPGPSLELKTNAQIEDGDRKSSSSSTIVVLLNQEDASHIVLGNYQLKLWAGDSQYGRQWYPMLVQLDIGTAVDTRQLLVSVDSEVNFDLSASDVRIVGTVSIANVIDPNENED